MDYPKQITCMYCGGMGQLRMSYIPEGGLPIYAVPSGTYSADVYCTKCAFTGQRSIMCISEIGAKQFLWGGKVGTMEEAVEEAIRLFEAGIGRQPKRYVPNR